MQVTDIYMYIGAVAKNRHKHHGKNETNNTTTNQCTIGLESEYFH